MPSPVTPQNPIACLRCSHRGDCRDKHCPTEERGRSATLAHYRTLIYRRRALGSSSVRPAAVATEAFLEHTDIVALVDGIWRRYPLRSYTWTVELLPTGVVRETPEGQLFPATKSQLDRAAALCNTMSTSILDGISPSKQSVWLKYQYNSWVYRREEP